MMSSKSNSFSSSSWLFVSLSVFSCEVLSSCWASWSCSFVIGFAFCLSLLFIFTSFCGIFKSCCSSGLETESLFSSISFVSLSEMFSVLYRLSPVSAFKSILVTGVFSVCSLCLCKSEFNTSFKSLCKVFIFYSISGLKVSSTEFRELRSFCMFCNITAD